MNPLAVLGLAGLAYWFLMRKKPVTSTATPQRYIGVYDRLPSLQAELTQRQTAVRNALKVLASSTDPSLRADMQRIVDTDTPIIERLRKEIASIT